MSSQIWFDRNDINNTLMNDNKEAEVRIKCEFVDLPGVYHYQDKNFKEFFEKLSETD